jgi:hypothetical protein
MKVRSIFPPILQRHQQLVRQAEFRRSPRIAFLLRFRFQHVHPFSKGVWANAAQPFERFGFEMLNLLLGHRLCLLDLFVLIFQTFARGLLIAFHQSAYRNFKWFYTQLVCRYWRKAFPGLVSYNRSVEWMPSALIP